jgi:hypothetical protein
MILITNKSRKSIFAIAAACMLCTFSFTAHAERIPAKFEGNEPKHSFPDLLVFPDVSGNLSIMMLCWSQIEISGKMTDTFCMIRNNTEAAFGKSVQDAAKKARMVPAVIDGKRRKVYLQFRVEYIKEGDSKQVIVYSNPGDAENIEAYGKQHIAAQRVIGKEAWIKTCPGRADFGLTARAHVSIEGVASSVSLAHGYGIVPPGLCQQAIIETIESSPFIPAFADGEPVPSAFLEPFGN